jgi:hypothetical protein
MHRRILVFLDDTAGQDSSSVMDTAGAASRAHPRRQFAGGVALPHFLYQRDC